VRLLAPIAILSAAFAALAVPALAPAQAPAPKLTEDSSGTFPDKVFYLQLPSRRALDETSVKVTENGTDVLALGVESAGKSGSGAVLLIDASNSMEGAAIKGAMAAARAFLEQRSEDLPVAVVVFGPSDSVLTDFTTDSEKLTEAVAENPELAEGTHIYDALTKVTELAQDEKLARTTVVLLSDGTDVGSETTLADAVAAANAASVRVIGVGLRSSQYDPGALRKIAAATGGTYAEGGTPKALAPIFAEIGARISNEYVVTYRSLLRPEVKATVKAAIAGWPTATARYTTPAIDFAPRGSFERGWIDKVIVSPWLLLFILVVTFVLIAFAILTAVDVRKRSIRRRMAQYVTVPSEEESRARRAEVAAVLAEKAQRRVGRHRWWQRFETDVELGGFSLTPLALAAWTIVGGIVASIAAAILLQSVLGLLVGLAAPMVTRYVVSRRVRKAHAAFAEQLPDNLDVIAGALRTGHALMGALSVMVDSADEPSKSEFRRVLQDEQLGVPLDDAIRVMARRMQSQDAEQVAMVMQLQREAGGNTAEVLDRVAETIRGRMELRRLVDVLTAQARISRWILTALPIAVLVLLFVTGGDYLDPMLDSMAGIIALVVGAILIVVGSLWIKRISKLEV